MATYYWVGGTGTWDNTNTTNWSASSGGAGGSGPPISTDTVIFDGNSGSGTCTTAATAAASIITVNSTTLGLTFGAAFTMSGAFTLTQGALDLGNNTLTCLNFLSNNANTRSIACGTGSIKTTIKIGIAWDIRDQTGFSITGSKQLIVQPVAGGTIGVTVNHRGLNSTEANAINLQMISSTANAGLTIVNTSFVNNLDLSQFTNTAANPVQGINIYGNLSLSSTTAFETASTFSWTFAATSGTKTIQTSGVTLNFPLIFNGVGGSWQLVDNLTLGTTRAFTLTNGTFDAAGNNVSIGSFALGSGTKTLTLGSGTWTVAGNWNANTNVSNLTVSASTGTISMTSASAKTFSGGARTWPTLNQGGAGALTIAQSNTFTNITNTYAATGATTITFTAGTTQTLTQFTASGAAGNILTLNSSTPAGTYTLSDSGGTNSVSYCNISDSIATGGATWLAYTDNGNVNAGNNAGWIFSAIPLTYAQKTGVKLRSMAQRGGF